MIPRHTCVAENFQTMIGGSPALAWTSAGMLLTYETTGV
jgi:hypothetical protein